LFYPLNYGAVIGLEFSKLIEKVELNIKTNTNYEIEILVRRQGVYRLFLNQI
jgi:hypothetical protein